MSITRHGMDRAAGPPPGCRAVLRLAPVLELHKALVGWTVVAGLAEYDAMDGPLRTEAQQLSRPDTVRGVANRSSSP
ncbi:hypothetical protein ACCO45_009567 [Purpureocillium lilacinum]|uniref:Uncharacterized protein n=1 Tax=Purpureocillium lilacinum TaxID=33203 RepID=A0ACC4DKC2_PURLI